jgi:hypothetical protein
MAAEDRVDGMQRDQADADQREQAACSYHANHFWCAKAPHKRKQANGGEATPQHNAENGDGLNWTTYIVPAMVDGGLSPNVGHDLIEIR